MQNASALFSCCFWLFLPPLYSLLNLRCFGTTTTIFLNTNHTIFFMIITIFFNTNNSLTRIFYDNSDFFKTIETIETIFLCGFCLHQQFKELSLLSLLSFKNIVVVVLNIVVACHNIVVVLNKKTQ